MSRLPPPLQFRPCSRENMFSSVNRISQRLPSGKGNSKNIYILWKIFRDALAWTDMTNRRRPLLWGSLNRPSEASIWRLRKSRLAWGIWQCAAAAAAAVLIIIQTKRHPATELIAIPNLLLPRTSQMTAQSLWLRRLKGKRIADHKPSSTTAEGVSLNVNGQRRL